ncbi:hypothetical protein GCM10010260_24150 [Streptomyces filipinensis]|uniref:Uncharacterized protein n=1 Tax=Streptomyces filipinensis TaxID=66887 RepID=A0A918IAU4_9ACTN|nr:hypothetical protein GCM10010260_24150 [Streptomyces filipinensis]
MICRPAALSTASASSSSILAPPDVRAVLGEFDILGGRGFISFLAVPRHQCVYVCNVTWYG